MQAIAKQCSIDCGKGCWKRGSDYREKVGVDLRRRIGVSRSKHVRFCYQGSAGGETGKGEGWALVARLEASLTRNRDDGNCHCHNSAMSRFVVGMRC